LGSAAASAEVAALSISALARRDDRPQGARFVVKREKKKPVETGFFPYSSARPY
jgi:hypothetical protein